MADSGKDFSENEEEAAKIVAGGFEKADAKKLDEMAADGTLKEICREQEND